MTSEQIREIFSRDIEYELKESLYRNIEDNIGKFVKNDKIKYKKQIEIIFTTPWNSYNKYENNACARKILDEDRSFDKYEVFICPLLVKDLYRFAFYIAGYKKFHIKLEDEERTTFAFHLFHLWVQFILLHEYSHVILGHVDYRKDANFIISEFIDVESLSNEKLIESQGMELEADSVAAEFLFATILLNEQHIKHAFKHEYAKKDSLFDYLLGLNLLFHFFDLRSQIKIKGSHPLGVERALFFQGSVLKQSNFFKDRFNLSEEELNLQSGLALIDYLEFTGIQRNKIEDLLTVFVKKMKTLDEQRLRTKWSMYRLV